MCYHKALTAKYETLTERYGAAWTSVREELDVIREQHLLMRNRNQQEEPYSKEELSRMRTDEKTLSSFREDGVYRYHENGFDFMPGPVVTLGAPDEFKLFRWGMIPFWVKDNESAAKLRIQTLNCISEEMYDKPSFRDAAKNNQRCLIPVTGFFEWQWADEKGKNKTPFFIHPGQKPVVSIAGLYSRWRDKTTSDYVYTYTVLTTVANPLMAEIHNSKKRMPVIIPPDYERDWLNPNLSKDDVLALCRPIEDDFLGAYKISKLITTKDADTNVPEVMAAL